MKKGFRYLLFIGLPILGVAGYFYYADYAKHARIEACRQLAGRYFKLAADMRLTYINDLGAVRQTDIKGKSDLKNIPLLLNIKKNLEEVHQIETSYDSAGLRLIANWTDSLTTFRNLHPLNYPDSLLNDFQLTLDANRRFFDSIRIAYKVYYSRYTNLIDQLVKNNSKISVTNDQIMFMDKPFGIKFNELQVQFSQAVDIYGQVVTRMKSTFTEKLRSSETLFHPDGIDALIALLQNK